MSFDNLCKYLSEKYPDAFATWLLGHPPSAPVEVLKTELSIEPIRADFVTFLSTQERILHLEFQVKVATEPPLCPANAGLLGATLPPPSPPHHPSLDLAAPPRSRYHYRNRISSGRDPPSLPRPPALGTRPRASPANARPDAAGDFDRDAIA